MTGAIKETGEGEQSVPPIQAKFRGIKKLYPFVTVSDLVYLCPRPFEEWRKGIKLFPSPSVHLYPANNSMKYIYENSQTAKSYRDNVLRTRKTTLANSVFELCRAITLYPCPCACVIYILSGL